MTPSRPGDPSTPSTPDYGPRRLTVELINTCNLHCGYCLRDEDALHHDPARSLPVDLFARVAREARDLMGIEHIMFTGGEPTLHREFGEVIAAVASLSLTCSFVTNGWHFDRVWPLIDASRQAITHVSFSLDGTTRDTHDRWRGRGSFDRVVRAFSRCWASRFPFQVKVGIRRDTLPDLERFAIFAARLGAAGLSFSHLLPTTAAVTESLELTAEERAAAEREIAVLARIFTMPIGIDVGYYTTSRTAPCAPLAGANANVDYRGRLTLCCNLSGFRGVRDVETNVRGADRNAAAVPDADVVGDLTKESFAAALERLRQLAADQSAHRLRVLDAHAAAGTRPDLTIGSPCLFCLSTLGKTKPATGLAIA